MKKRSARLLLRAALPALLAAQLGYAGSAQAAAFPDVTGHWAERTIEWAAAQGIADGYEDGMFHPDSTVSEPEFLALLERAFPEAGQPDRGGDPWYEGYYRLAEANGWTVVRDVRNLSFTRGNVAQLIASTQGEKLDVGKSVQYLLDRKLADGKTAATVDGFAPGDRLTRAEAVQLIKNAKERGLRIAPMSSASSAKEPQAAADHQIRGLSVGLSKADLLSKLGQPARIDASEYGFEWYVYNSDLMNYVQVGVQDDRVTALYTNADNWSFAGGLEPGAKESDVVKAYGDPLDSIKKGDTRYDFNSRGEYGMYLLNGRYVTFFYDLQEDGRVSAVQLIEQGTEESLHAFYGTPGDMLRQSYEREIFDLANVERKKRGLAPFAWHDKLADVVRLHCDDMAEQGYFAHENQQGTPPWERADAAGLSYSSYGENIAAGQQNAIHAHHNWLNSPGHRKNLLGSFEFLGVGVAFGGKMHVYYGQNFMNP